MTSVRVSMENRVFIVDFDENNNPLRIKERKMYAKGSPFEAFYNATYWNAKHHNLSKKPAEIIKRALNAKS